MLVIERHCPYPASRRQCPAGGAFIGRPRSSSRASERGQFAATVRAARAPRRQFFSDGEALAARSPRTGQSDAHLPKKARQCTIRRKSRQDKGERLRQHSGGQRVCPINVGSCAGFSDACITKASTRSHDRRPRSAKARNRGPEGALFRRCDLWGFEECERLFSRGRNYGRTAS
jgi:hypothetical protein